jgi:hypothetical protein
MLAFTCESCEAQPQRIANVDLMRGGVMFTRATLCLDCLDIANSLPAIDPRVVALFNRVADFKDAWPEKAKMNRIAHAATICNNEPARALEIVQELYAKPARAGRGEIRA